MMRRDEYSAYLRSPQWRKLSKSARDRAGNRCEFCGSSADHVHHVKYPKRFKDDHIDNLIVVCEFHHSMLHGIRGEEMSGDLIVVDGVDVMVRDEERWFDFIQLFERIFDPDFGDRGGASMNNLMGRASGSAWSMVYDCFKIVTQEDGPGGEKRIRKWVNMSGAGQLAGKYDSTKTEQFQKWLYGTLIPDAMRKDSPVASTGNPHADMALAIQSQAGQIAQNFLQLDAVRKIAHEANVRVEVVEKRTDELVSRLDEMTGGDFYMTARMALNRVKVDPQGKYKDNQTNAMALGSYCSNQARLRGIDVPKIPEGTFMVGQYPKAMLRDGLVALGLWCPSPEPKSINPPSQVITEVRWREIVNNLHLGGMAWQILSHSRFVRATGDRVMLELSPDASHLRSPQAEMRIYEALRQATGREIKLDIMVKR